MMIEQTVAAPQKSSSLSTAAYVRVFAVGMLLGIIFIKSDVASWQRINDMFLFNEPHMYLIIGTAVLVAGLSMLLIKTFELRDFEGERVVYQPKPYHRGVVLGGAIFGMGWAVTGACPGPIYAQIGAGEWIALLTWLGALGGMYLYGWLRPRLPH